MRARTRRAQACLALLGMLATPAFGQSPRAVPALPADRLLVMPFENPAAEARLYWLREGAAVLLAEDLRAAGAPVIGRDERLRAFERLGVPAAASLSDATVIKIGELLGATTVIVGSLALEQDHLQVRARSLRLDTGRLQAEITDEAPLPDLFRLFDRMLVRLAPTFGTPPGHGEKDHAPLAAFENYIKGLIADTPGSQVVFLRAALAQYPGYDLARLALWQVYSAQGDQAQAAKTALETQPQSPLYNRACFLAALSYMRLRDNDRAFDLLNALAQRSPAAAAFNNMGVVQLRRGTPAPGGSATYFFNKAHEVEPADGDYDFNLGYAYLLERDLLAAAHWLREAVRRNPSDGEAHYALGVALSGTGAGIEGGREKELARRLSSTFGEWDRRPASDPVPRGLERVKDDLQATVAARPEFAFEEAEQKDQQALAGYHLDAGRRLFAQGKDREATAELERVVYLAPYQPEAHLLLGRINLRNGRVQEAIGDLKIALWSQESAAAHVALGEAYLQAKDVAAARAEAQRALALDPKMAEAKKLLDRLDSAR